MASYSTIRQGSSNKNDIKVWQNYLKSQGYDIGSTGADGIFGSKTLAATKQYQKDNGLSVDGIVGKNTWGSMTSNTKNTNKTTNTSKTTTTTAKATAKNAVASGVKQATKPAGVDQDVWDKRTSSFDQSKEVDSLYKETQNAYNDAKDVLSQKDIIDQATKDKMNKELVFSDAYYQAMDMMNSKLQELTDGKTKWTDKYEEAMNNYLNREDFEYDVDQDPLFQQALASAMNSGKSAMQDTIGQASALTGGYGSTYATSAGNQAYNAFIEDAYNNLPEYYNMALQAYQAEGQEMYNQVAMLGEADANEFQREYTEWQASFENANQIWNKEFSTWEAETNQAYNSANIQLQEYGQKAENAYNLYNMASSQYESKYAKEYQEWADMVTQMGEIANTQNADYWSKTNFDESVRQYEKNYQQTEKWNQKNLDYKNAALKQDQDQFNKTFNASYTSDGKGGYVAKRNTSSSNYSLTDTEIKNVQDKYQTGGVDAVMDYLEVRGKAPSNQAEADIVAKAYSGTSSAKKSTDMTSKEFWDNAEITKTKDTINWFWGNDDYDDEVKINGKIYTLKQVHEMLGKAGFDGTTKDAFIKKLSELDEDTIFTWKNGVKSNK